jgi:hypothetical protein
MFHGALSEGGYFVTEQTQKLPPEVGPLFRQVTSAGQVFQKVSSPHPPTPSPTGREEVQSVGEDGGEALRIKSDRAFNKVSRYTWLNLEMGEQRVGKLRVDKADQRLVIHSLTVYVEFERNGYARRAVEFFKERHQEIIAADARAKARGFWQKMGFEDDGQGNYVWRNESPKSAPL